MSDSSVFIFDEVVSIDIGGNPHEWYGSLPACSCFAFTHEQGEDDKRYIDQRGEEDEWEVVSTITGDYSNISTLPDNVFVAIFQGKIKWRTAQSDGLLEIVIPDYVVEKKKELARIHSIWERLQGMGA